jgi:hypothetical protein
MLISYSLGPCNLRGLQILRICPSLLRFIASLFIFLFIYFILCIYLFYFMEYRTVLFFRDGSWEVLFLCSWAKKNCFGRYNFNFLFCLLIFTFSYLKCVTRHCDGLWILSDLHISSPLNRNDFFNAIRISVLVFMYEWLCPIAPC